MTTHRFWSVCSETANPDKSPSLEPRTGVADRSSQRSAATLVLYDATKNERVKDTFS